MESPVHIVLKFLEEEREVQLLMPMNLISSSEQNSIL